MMQKKWRFLHHYQLSQLFAGREGVAGNGAELDVVVVNRVVSNWTQFAVVNLAVSKDTIIGAYIHNAPDKVVTLRVIRYHFALQSQRQLVDYWSIDHLRTYSCKARLGKLVWLFITRNDTHIVARRELLNGRHTNRKSLCSKDIFRGFMPLRDTNAIWSSVNIPPHAAFIALGLPVSSYAATISTGIG